MRQLVLGLAYGYKWITLAVFVRSLRATGYQGEIALFLGGADRRTPVELRRHGVHVIPATLAYPFHASLAPCRGVDVGHLDAASPHVRRYAMYGMFLRDAAERYDDILLTDVKDVLFQRPPFDFPRDGAEICFFEEDPDRFIRDCPLNSRWLSEPFGAEALARVADRPILCSGTTLGTGRAIAAYCETMLACMTEHRIVGLGGDQGAHNYLVYTHGFEGMRLFPNESGPVLTMAMRKRPPSFDVNGNVLNARGEVPNVVHQYDRVPAVMDRVNRRYLSRWQRGWVALAQMKAQWRRRHGAGDATVGPP
jgi:hypothetical protein